MKDLLLTDDEDLYLSDGADVEFTDSVIQAIKIRLKWFLGEWKMNTDYGMPYYDEVFIKNPSTALLESRIRKEILTVDEVLTVDSVSVSINKATRKATVTFTVTIEEGSESGEVTIDV